MAMVFSLPSLSEMAPNPIEPTPSARIPTKRRLLVALAVTPASFRALGKKNTMPMSDVRLSQIGSMALVLPSIPWMGLKLNFPTLEMCGGSRSRSRENPRAEKSSTDVMKNGSLRSFPK